MASPHGTPTEVLKARGTFREDRHGGRPQGNNCRPDCPGDMRGEALTIWKRTIERLEAMKILDSVDGEYLADYCHAAAEVVACRKVYAEQQGKLKRLQNSRAKDVLQKIEVARVLLKQASIDYRAARDALYKAGDRLGIGPVGRARTKADASTPPATDGKGRFFKTVG